MIIRSPEPEVKILVDRDPIKTSFEEWARPGHFSRTIAKGPDTTTWIWNLHADAHDFDSHTSDLEEISRKVFSAHFGQLSIIFLWLSGMYFHGARFSNYEAWLSDPTHIGPSAQVVWPIVGQEILNGDVGGGFRGIQITSGFFQIWRASGNWRIDLCSLNAFCWLVPLSQSCSKIGLVSGCRIYVESPFSRATRAWVPFLGGASSTCIFTD